MLKIDFHTHTCRSPDAVHDIRRMVKRAKQVGLDGIAITDHNRLLDNRIAKKISREFDLVVLPGVEGGKITSEKHWIGIGITSLPSSSSITLILKHIRDEGGIAIAPHPWTGKGFRSFGSLGFDAVEILNGTTPLANNFVKNLFKIPEIAGSDAHASHMLGYTWTEVESAADPDEIMEAVSRGLCRPAGGIVPLWCHPVFWGMLGLVYGKRGVFSVMSHLKGVKCTDSNYREERVRHESSSYPHN